MVRMAMTAIVMGKEEDRGDVEAMEEEEGEEAVEAKEAEEVQSTRVMARARALRQVQDAILSGCSPG